MVFPNYINKFSLVLASAKTLIALGFASLSGPLLAYRLAGGMGWGMVSALTTPWLFCIGCECDSVLNTTIDKYVSHCSVWRCDFEVLFYVF